MSPTRAGTLPFLYSRIIPSVYTTTWPIAVTQLILVWMNEWIHFIALSLHETPLYRGRNRLREVMWRVQGSQLKNDPVQLWRWVFWLQKDTSFLPINMLRTAQSHFSSQIQSLTLPLSFNTHLCPACSLQSLDPMDPSLTSRPLLMLVPDLENPPSSLSAGYQCLAILWISV